MTAFNFEQMTRDSKFLVQLACGHYKYTGALNKARCPRCTEMLRRAMVDGSEDYLSFRQGSDDDRMIWKDDPCRSFNEPTDLAGNFTRD